MPLKYEQIYVAEAKKSRTVCSTGASCSPLRGRVWNVFPYKYPQEGRNEGKTFKQVLLFFQIKKAVQTRTVGSLFFRTAVRYVRL
jgi:hypothetical protein